MLDSLFSGLSIWLNVLVFVVAASIIWFAGTKLEHAAEGIATHTGLGRAFVGLLLLAAATSLPEVATTTTASLGGNSSLAVHNLLGGVVIQTAVLAIADLVAGRNALTFLAPHFVLLIEGVGVIFLLAIVLIGMAVGSEIGSAGGLTSTIGVGIWLLLLALAYVLVLYVTYRSQRQSRWTPDTPSNASRNRDIASSKDTDSQHQKQQPEKQSSAARRSLTQICLAFAGFSLLVLVAGWAVAKSGETFAKQTGLGSSFVGATLVALATSLPEISTTVSAAKNDRYETAFSNIFGSNSFDITLLILVGLLASGPALIQSASPSAMLAAGVGVLVTCIYLWGLLEREDRTILRIGWDSAAVLIVSLAGAAGIYALR